MSQSSIASITDSAKARDHARTIPVWASVNPCDAAGLNEVCTLEVSNLLI